MTRHFTEPTTDYWQRIVAADAIARPDAPWQFGYPARLPDGRVLVLPIRQLANEPSHAVASLLVNHASLEVVETLGAMLAERLSTDAPDLVIGLPTLGLALAPVVARSLGHARYVPMGYSRKFWYDEALSTAVHSITSPTPGKRIYLDPNLRPLIEGKRLVLVDDAVSTGTTLRSAWDLIESLGGNVVACGVAMLQSRRWVEQLGAERAARVVGVFESPLLKAVPEGWMLRD
ncbi:MAG: phosphoribosyltransferase [Variovorax sp.]|nr:phosphoribosyltransferase [Variovorax sp.]